MTYADANIVINVNLAPTTGVTQDFSTILLLVDEAEGTGNTLDGDRFREYTSITAANADRADTFITVAVLQAISDFFSQTPRLQKIIVGRVDTAAAEVYAGAVTGGLELCIAGGANFYGVCIDKRTTAEIKVVSSAIEALDFYLFVLQSADADWLTTGFPAALAALSGRQRTVICYHDIATEWMDVCYAGARLRPNPDQISGSWPGALDEVLDYTTPITTGGQGFAFINGVNLGMLYGAASFYVGPGYNAEASGDGLALGRPVHQVVTADWYKTRLRERVTALVLQFSNRNEKIVMGIAGQTNTPGQVAFAGAANGILLQGERGKSPHFVPGQTKVTTEALTAADITAEELRFKVEGTFAQNARTFEYNVFLGLTAVNPTA